MLNLMQGLRNKAGKRKKKKRKVDENNLKRYGNKTGLLAGLFNKLGSMRGQNPQGPVSNRRTKPSNPMAGKPLRPERESPGMSGYQRYTKPYGRGGRRRR